MLDAFLRNAELEKELDKQDHLLSSVGLVPTDLSGIAIRSIVLFLPSDAFLRNAKLELVHFLPSVAFLTECQSFFD